MRDSCVLPSFLSDRHTRTSIGNSPSCCPVAIAPHEIFPAQLLPYYCQEPGPRLVSRPREEEVAFVFGGGVLFFSDGAFPHEGIGLLNADFCLVRLLFRPSFCRLLRPRRPFLSSRPTKLSGLRMNPTPSWLTPSP